MQKDTTKIVEELALCPDFRTFYTENEENFSTAPLADLLNTLLREKRVSRSQVIKKAELNEVYGYQIFSGLRTPDRKKLLCLAFGMGLTAEETQTLLKSAGYPPLYVKRPFDSIVLYGFHRGLSVSELNDMLFEYGLDTLG